MTPSASRSIHSCVTVSAMRMMGKRLPVASARAAASNRLISIPGRLHVNQRQSGRMGRGQRRQCRFGREKDLDVRLVGGQHGFKSREQRRLSRGEQVNGSGIGEHPDLTSLMNASARLKNYLEE